MRRFEIVSKISWPLYGIGGLSVALLIPYFDFLFIHGEETPSIVSLFGVAAFLMTMTVLVISASNEKLQLNNEEKKYIFLFLGLIISTKFILVPATLYYGYRDYPFGNFLTIPFITAIVFSLYASIYFVIGHGYKRKLSSLVERVNHKQSDFFGKRLTTALIFSFGIVFAVLCYAVSSLSLFFFLINYITAIQYLFYVVVSLHGLATIALLIGAGLFCRNFFQSLTRECLVNRDGEKFLFWGKRGIQILIFIHIVWAIYFYTINTLWPLMSSGIIVLPFL